MTIKRSSKQLYTKAVDPKPSGRTRAVSSVGAGQPPWSVSLHAGHRIYAFLLDLTLRDSKCRCVVVMVYTVLAGCVALESNPLSSICQKGRRVQTIIFFEEGLDDRNDLLALNGEYRASQETKELLVESLCKAPHVADFPGIGYYASLLFIDDAGQPMFVARAVSYDCLVVVDRVAKVGNQYRHRPDKQPRTPLILRSETFARIIYDYMATHRKDVIREKRELMDKAGQNFEHMLFGQGSR